MKAREIISHSSRDAALASILCQALELAWERIAETFGADEHAAERARAQLAAILLALPTGDPPNPQELADIALETMALERKPR
jgi:hypothetical protein